MGKQNNTPADQPRIINLDDILKKPVAGDFSAPSFTLDGDETIEEAVQIDDPSAEEQAQQEQAAQATEPGSFMPPRAFAETAVNLFDGLQSAALPWLREKKIFTANELELLHKIENSGNMMYSSGSPEAVLLEKWHRHKKITEKMPFSPGEKKRLIDATARYAETTDIQVTPLQGLMMSWSEVFLTRATYFFND